MKTISRLSILLGILLFSSVSLFSQQDQRHVGTWMGESDGETGYFEFDDEGYVSMTSGGETIGGKSFEVEGMEACIKYVIDYTTTPYYIDLVMYSLESNEEMGRFKGMFIYNEKKQMILCLNFEDTSRPWEFTEDNTITMDKIEE